MVDQQVLKYCVSPGVLKRSSNSLCALSWQRTSASWPKRLATPSMMPQVSSKLRAVKRCSTSQSGWLMCLMSRKFQSRKVKVLVAPANCSLSTLRPKSSSHTFSQMNFTSCWYFTVLESRRANFSTMPSLRYSATRFPMVRPSSRQHRFFSCGDLPLCCISWCRYACTKYVKEDFSTCVLATFAGVLVEVAVEMEAEGSPWSSRSRLPLTLVYALEFIIQYPLSLAVQDQPRDGGHFCRQLHGGVELRGRRCVRLGLLIRLLIHLLIRLLLHFFRRLLLHPLPTPHEALRPAGPPLPAPACAREGRLRLRDVGLLDDVLQGLQAVQPPVRLRLCVLRQPEDAADHHHRQHQEVAAGDHALGAGPLEDVALAADLLRGLLGHQASRAAVRAVLVSLVVSLLVSLLVSAFVPALALPLPLPLAFPLSLRQPVAAAQTQLLPQRLVLPLQLLQTQLQPVDVPALVVPGALRRLPVLLFQHGDLDRGVLLVAVDQHSTDLARGVLLALERPDVSDHGSLPNGLQLWGLGRLLFLS